MNWFEGGRRILALISGLVLLGGVIYAVFGGGESQVIVETSQPDERFKWTLHSCNYPDQEKPWINKIRYGDNAPVTTVACFRVNTDGQIWIGYGPETELAFPRGKSGATLPHVKIRKMISADTYSDQAEAYMHSRMDSFKFTDQEMQKIGRDQWMIGWTRFWDRVQQAVSWVAGIVAGLWALATVLGWIVRGFAGIPNGQDFKKTSANHPVTSKSATNKVLGVGLGCAVFLGVVANAITAGTLSVVPFVAQFFVKILLIVEVFLALFLGVAGGYGLWLLTCSITKRDPDKLPDNAIIVASIINLVLVAIASFPLNAYTIVGTWMDAVDRWSRANGYADGGTMGVFALSLLWPYIPFLIMAKHHRSVAVSAPTSPTE